MIPGGISKEAVSIVYRVKLMAESDVDLGSLLKLIVENKPVKSNLTIDRTCTIRASDPKPLIKIFNYLLNYLSQITRDVIEIMLKAQSDGCLLCFIISTDNDQLPPLSKNLDDVLKTYNSAMRVVFEKGKYLQILISFCQEHVPETVIIEV